jgi:REP element-mobilizing transposase RayT
MTRHARLHAPLSVVHVIARTVNREFRLGGLDERRAVLDCIARALERTDWRVLAYAIMSSHYHLVMLAGHDRPSTFLRSAQTAIATRLNHEEGRSGPVFAERPRTIVVAPARVAQLVAYVHNNPVRAGLVARPEQSDWTSHRAWLGAVSPPTWLDVAEGLRRVGVDDTPDGIADFAALVLARSGDPRDALLSATALSEHRRAVRRALALPVEVASPLVSLEHGALAASVVQRDEPTLQPRWQGPIEHVFDRVSAARGIDRSELCSRRRSARIVDARRLAVALCVQHLRISASEVSAGLGISRSAVSMLLRGASRVRGEAARMAASVRSTGDGVQ